MMTKLAHIRENRKNNKGFSLVELIIVIAIMVALIAVMGPQYVKYVQSSRDAVVGDAAESTLSVVKSEYALNNLQSTDVAHIYICAANGNGNVVFKCDGNVLYGPEKNATNYKLVDILGIDTNKTVKSDVVYTITITPAAKVSGSTVGTGYTFTMSKADTGASASAIADNVEPATVKTTT